MPPAQRLPPRPHNPLAGRPASPSLPEARPHHGESTGAGRPASGLGQFRPRYSDRDYAGHTYWEGSRDTATPDHTGSWRLDEMPAARPELTAPPMDGFDEDRDYPVALWWTAIWYAAPILLYVVLALFISSSTVRSHALHALVSDAPGVVFAIAISLGVATGVRRATLAWRPITVGLGATIVGAGIATLLISAF